MNWHKLHWRKHPIYKQYLASSVGLVKHENKQNNRQPREDRYGYLRININHEGKIVTVPVHVFVWESFNGLRNGKTINHIDGNKHNNRLDNLEAVASGENTSLSFRLGHRSAMCHPVDGFYSKRERERETGIRRQQSRGTKD